MCDTGFSGDDCTTINCGVFGENQEDDVGRCDCDAGYEPIYVPIGDDMPACRRLTSGECAPEFGYEGALCSRRVKVDENGDSGMSALVGIAVVVAVVALVFCIRKFRKSRKNTANLRQGQFNADRQRRQNMQNKSREASAPAWEDSAPGMAGEDGYGRVEMVEVDR